MPWREVCPMEEKMRFVLAAVAEEDTIAALCEEFGVSRKTGYKWLKRYLELGPGGLVDGSHAPQVVPWAISQAQREAIVGVRRAHPSWGPKKLRAKLAACAPEQSWPAPSTIGELLHREGLSRTRKRRRRAVPNPGALSVPVSANDLWCIDFKGWFRTGDGARCDPLTVSDAAGTTQFTYNALGRRQSKLISGVSTQFRYDVLNPVQEASGGVLTQLLTGLGVDEFYAWTDSVTTRTFLSDALSSTVALTDDAGTVQTTYTYEPFGASQMSGASANAYQFTGREDDGTGLYYYRARYYHPALQRFTAEDPLLNVFGSYHFGLCMYGPRSASVLPRALSAPEVARSQAFNAYAYVENNPTARTDPLGLSIPGLSCEGSCAAVCGVFGIFCITLGRGVIPGAICAGLCYLTCVRHLCPPPPPELVYPRIPRPGGPVLACVSGRKDCLEC